MSVRVEIEDIIPSRRLEKWTQEARDWLGVQVSGIEEVKVYKASAGKAEDVANTFTDPVLQRAHIAPVAYEFKKGTPSFVIEVSYRPGVTDNPGQAAAEALAVRGITAKVASGSLYFLFGDIGADGAQKVARELLANDLIQKADVYAANDFFAQKRFENVVLPAVTLTGKPHVETVSLDISDDGLETLSKERCLALTVLEMKHIREHFKKELTDVELEIIAQSWSEHCKHKIFAAKIEYQGKTINSLYKSYIKKATNDIKAARKLDWLVSVFSDNAGIVRFDDTVDVCIKVETHNSPSALDPYGGALTGILGVNRDILGAGMGARPIANMDVFCFAPPDMPAKGEEQFMPAGVKSPRRILEGVHKGVEDGGNKSGVPTVNGAFFFDRDYAGKPLVFVGTVGVLPHVLPDGRKAAEKMAAVGDRIVMVGGAIGADGIHGATFSSLEMDENAPATAVQIGDPITQKRMADFLLEARDLGLYSAITDNGAGGLSSSVGEMAQMTNGARLDLALCPVKYPGLNPWELMISESQERMSVAVPPANIADFLALAKRRGVVATDIGAFNDSGNLEVLYGGKVVGSLPLVFLHDSLPQMELKAEWGGAKPRKDWSATTRHAAEGRHLDHIYKSSPTQTAPFGGVAEVLLTLLASPNITSKEKWVRAYDHEVQAASHHKPFAGKGGPANAGVVWLHPHGGGEDVGVAIGNGLAPRMSLHDPYLMAQFAVDEAVRNVVVAGGDPDTCCLLDNFCWPDPVASAKSPEGAYRLGQLVRTCEGLYDICLAYGMPLVSGKDSMKNDFRGKDRRGVDIAFGVLPTLLVTSMARTQVGIAPGSDFKKAGDLVYVLGGAGQGLGASEYAHTYNVQDAAPSIDLLANMQTYRNLYKAMRAGLLSSAHDISEGGLYVALAESMIGGGLGVELNEACDSAAAFNEAPGRIVVSVAPEKQKEFEMLFVTKPMGKVTSAEKGFAGIAFADIEAAWKKGF